MGGAEDRGWSAGFGMGLEPFWRSAHEKQGTVLDAVYFSRRGDNRCADTCTQLGTGERGKVERGAMRPPSLGWVCAHTRALFGRLRARFLLYCPWQFTISTVGATYCTVQYSMSNLL
jgi:hypothetical protein